jgi:hypothetical protein
MDRRQISPRHGGAARDAGLRRASTLTKWIGVGAVTLVGALAGFVAQAKPGHSTSTGQTGGSSGSKASSSTRSANSNGNGGGGASAAAPSTSLAPPPTAPAPAPVPAPSSPGAVSGGS